MLKTGLPPTHWFPPHTLFSRKNLMKHLDLSVASGQQKFQIQATFQTRFTNIPKQDFPNYEPHLNSAIPEFPTTN